MRDLASHPTRVRVTNGNLDLSPIAFADIAPVSPTSVELRRFGDCCTAMPMGVALREVHRQGRTSLWLHKQLIFNVAFVIEAAVLLSSAESKVDDGQVEQEDIAPEEEDQEGCNRPRGDAQTSGAHRTSQRLKEVHGKGAALRPSRGHDAAHHDVLLPSPVILRLPEPLVRD